MEQVAAKPRRLLLWCVPRSCSTALAKCLSHVHPDTQVWIEPYNLSRTATILAKRDMDVDLPKDYGGNETLFDSVVEKVCRPMFSPTGSADDSVEVEFIPKLLS